MFGRTYTYIELVTFKLREVLGALAHAVLDVEGLDAVLQQFEGRLARLVVSVVALLLHQRLEIGDGKVNMFAC